MAVTGRPPFSDLPRELRDMIYIEYVIVEGGYVFNPRTGKLRPGNPKSKNHIHPSAVPNTYVTFAAEMRNPHAGKPRPKNPESKTHTHLFALQYTCKTAAVEMRDLALKHNSITFSFPDYLIQERHRHFPQLEDYYLKTRLKKGKDLSSTLTPYLDFQLPRKYNLRFPDAVKERGDMHKYVPMPEEGFFLTNEELGCLFGEDSAASPTDSRRNPNSSPTSLAFARSLLLISTYGTLGALRRSTLDWS
ncbi:hypothetical protein V8F33_003120 [Rhypophila sp. PSN 637]